MRLSIGWECDAQRWVWERCSPSETTNFLVEFIRSPTELKLLNLEQHKPWVSYHHSRRRNVWVFPCLAALNSKCSQTRPPRPPSHAFPQQRGESTRRFPDLPAPPDTRWVSRFVEWGLQGILRCRCWGVVVNVSLLSPTQTRSSCKIYFSLCSRGFMSALCGLGLCSLRAT